MLTNNHVPIYLKQFHSYSNHKCKKSPFSRTAAHIFLSPGDDLATITQYVAWVERQFNACQTPRSMYLSIFNSFRVIRCLSQCVNPKIAIFYHILFFSGDAPGAITLNVVWIEREFDAYKLCRSMYPSIFNNFPVIRTASAKNRRFHVPQPTFLLRDAMHKRGICRHAVSVCLSVRPSVTFVSCAKTNKDIFEIFFTMW